METEDGVVLAVKAHPGAKRVQIGPVQAAPESPGWPAGRLRVAVAVAAEGGRANEAIVQALAKWLGVKESRLVQQGGKTARDKRFLVTGGRVGEFAARFGALTGL